MDDDPRLATYRVIDGLLTEQQRALGDERRALETKAGLLAGFAAASVSFLLDRRGGPLWWCAVAAHGAALAAAMAVLAPRPAERPRAARLRDGLTDRPEVEAIHLVVRWRSRTVERAVWRLRAAMAVWCLAAALGW